MTHVSIGLGAVVTTHFMRIRGNDITPALQMWEMKF